jgi:serine/threonine protein kinase
MHALAPYGVGFDRVLRQEAAHCREYGLRIDDILFTKNLVGRGGFADVYRADHRNGSRLALKLFYTGPGVVPARVGLCRTFLRSIMDHQSLLSQEPFLAPRIIPADACWYVRDFGRGKPVKQAAHALTPRTSALAVASYARALDLVHRAGCCLVDNNWGALLVRDGRPSDVTSHSPEPQFAFCDYDTITRYSDLPTARVTTTSVYTRCNRSQEQELGLPQTPLGDIEALALMTDELFNGTQWYCLAPPENIARWARQDKRTYPADRRRKVPSALQHVVTSLLAYPRDGRLTAHDFFHAATYDAAQL